MTITRMADVERVINDKNNYMRIPEVKPYKKCKTYSDFFYYHMAQGCTPEAAEKLVEFDLE